MPQIYFASAKGLDIDAALSSVSPYRRQKALRLHDDEKLRASLAAELLLKLACGRTDYLISPDGKPYFADGAVHFSLSHCGEVAVCAVADSPIGVDVERIPDASPLKIAKRFFTESEYNAIASAPDPRSAFCELWVKKEAVIKALGVGLKGLSAADVNAFPTLHLTHGEYHIGVCLPESEIGDIEFHVQEDISRAV